MSKQIFAWTGPTPVGVGYARFIQAFDLEGLTQITIRDGEGNSHSIMIPRETAVELGRTLIGLGALPQNDFA